MKKSTLFLFFTFLFFSSFADGYNFLYNERCVGAYKEYLSLNMEDGNALIRQELAANPYNLSAVFISDYEDFFSLLFNGNKSQFDQFKNHLDARISLLEKGDTRNPWYRIAKAGIYMHWAMINLRMGENYKGAILFRKAYLLAKENQTKFPAFEQNKFFLGIGETVVGTLPDEYKWIASLFGMKGNVNKGLAKLTSFINNSSADDLLRSEAVIIHCYLKFYLQSRQQEVWNFVSGSQFPTQGNALHAFVKANIALNYRKADAALSTLKNIQSSKAYSMFPAFDYEMGSALLLKLDNNASVYFNKFINNDRGKLFVKDAYMQMAQSYYLQGNMQKAAYYRQQIKNNGSTNTDSDKQAQRFAEDNTWVAVPVLKARYLIDGGYYSRALDILNDCNVQSLSSVADKLEYYFRMGRAYDEMNLDAKAVQYYQTTISQGRERKEHFAARAALQLGLMYERLGKKQDAATMYRTCLSMKNHDFQANIDQQAKAGLDRLNF